MLRAFALVVVAAMLTACVGTQPRPSPVRLPTATDAPLPAYEDFAAAYNERVAGLPRLWARTVGRIWFPDEDGRIKTEQVEGHFQYLAPDRMLLTFDKVGQTYGLMGSNEERYWWIELDRERRAHVGDHSLVTPERIADLGLPIYPRDVIELMGITPLPESGSAATLARSEDGRMLVATAPMRPRAGQSPAATVGSRRIFVDPATHEPHRIEMLGTDGRLRIVAELSRYERISIPGGGPELPRPRVPGEVFVTTVGQEAQMRLRLYEPEAGSRRPREGVFDFDRLVQSYSVREVISLDAPRTLAR